MTDDPDYPRDENGQPICARPCQDGQPCYRQVPIAGTACHLHEDGQPILPLPDPVPTYTTDEWEE